MEIGVPKEVKDNEYRVAATPQFAKKLSSKLCVEENAGIESGFSDTEYENAGAAICSHKEAWGKELVLKVKEPQETEYRLFSPGKTLFTYLHLAGVSKQLTLELLKNKVTAIALESVMEDSRRVLLEPMSRVAGTMAVHVGANLLAKNHSGRGILLNDFEGVEHANVVVLGGGVVGEAALKVAHEIGADVTVLDINPGRLAELKKRYPRLSTLQSTPENVAASLASADLAIGSAVVPNARAPHLVNEQMVKKMKYGSVVVDVAIDQGGCFETSRPTTHSEPTFVKHGVVHYCVPNMPGVYPRTSTLALTHATFPFVEKMAKNGVEKELAQNSVLATGVNTFNGYVTNKVVAEALGLMEKYSPLADLL